MLARGIDAKAVVEGPPPRPRQLVPEAFIARLHPALLAHAGERPQPDDLTVLIVQRPAAGEQPRFYSISLQQDLLGGWVLMREWGQPGSRNSAKRELFLDRDDAIRALSSARDTQQPDL